MCLDLDHIQQGSKAYNKFPYRNDTFKYKKWRKMKILKYLQWKSIEGYENHKHVNMHKSWQVHKSEVDSHPYLH